MNLWSKFSNHGQGSEIIINWREEGITKNSLLIISLAPLPPVNSCVSPALLLSFIFRIKALLDRLFFHRLQWIFFWFIFCIRCKISHADPWATSFPALFWHLESTFPGETFIPQFWISSAQFWSDLCLKSAVIYQKLWLFFPLYHFICLYVSYSYVRMWPPEYNYLFP